MKPDMCRDFVTAIYELADHRDISQFETTGDDDFSFAIVGVSRFRVSTYKQRGSYSAVIRIITFTLPQPSELMIPDAVMELANTNKGMVLVTGPAGGGKSTTLACLIDKINTEQEAHIITLEDPLEYLHTHKKSIVSQREICTDTENYLTALRASLRQSPDVILLGEMRDYETINTAMTAAETGHLIFSTLHTIGALTKGSAQSCEIIFSVAAHHRGCQYHRPDHRCISSCSAASGSGTALYGITRSRIPASAPDHGWKNGSGF